MVPRPRPRILAPMTRPRLAAVAALLLALSAALAAPPAAAQEGTDPLTVGVYVSPPFVMKTATGYTGMAIDLWEQFAATLGQPYAYREIANVRDLIDAVA